MNVNWELVWNFMVDGPAGPAPIIAVGFIIFGIIYLNFFRGRAVAKAEKPLWQIKFEAWADALDFTQSDAYQEFVYVKGGSGAFDKATQRLFETLMLQGLAHLGKYIAASFLFSVEETECTYKDNKIKVGTQIDYPWASLTKELSKHYSIPAAAQKVFSVVLWPDYLWNALVTTVAAGCEREDGRMKENRLKVLIKIIGDAIEYWTVVQTTGAEPAIPQWYWKNGFCDKPGKRKKAPPAKPKAAATSETPKRKEPATTQS